MPRWQADRLCIVPSNSYVPRMEAAGRYDEKSSRLLASAPDRPDRRLLLWRLINAVGIVARNSESVLLSCLDSLHLWIRQVT